MPATAGRVRMPANNRVHSSAALQTHGIWQSAIGYDPYAPSKEKKKGKDKKVDASSSDSEDEENTYASFQGLLALAKVTNSNVDEYRGACKKCGRVGHLTFQCRNFLSMKDDKDRDLEAFEAGVRSEYYKVKKTRGKVNESEESSSSSSEESESEDSDYDSEMEKQIAKKFGKKVSRKSKKKVSGDNVSDREDKKKRGRSRKRSGKKVVSDSDSEDNSEKMRKKEKQGRALPLEVKDERQHRWGESRRENGSRISHRRSEDSYKVEDSNERWNSRAAADCHNSGLEDSRVGRERKKRPEKKTMKHSYDREDRYAVNMSY